MLTKSLPKWHATVEVAEVVVMEVVAASVEAVVVVVEVVSLALSLLPFHPRWD